MMICTDFSS